MDSKVVYNVNECAHALFYIISARCVR